MAHPSILLLAILSGAALGSPSAATFNGTVIRDAVFNMTDPGLPVRAHPIPDFGSQVQIGGPIKFENPNAIGDSSSLPPFGVQTPEATINPDDVALNPSAPLLSLAGFDTAAVSGTTVGAVENGSNSGRIVFGNIALIRVSGTEQILISLTSAIVDEREGSLRPAKSNGAVISAPATLAAVPVLASLPLAAFGLWRSGAVPCRQKAQAV